MTPGSCLTIASIRCVSVGRRHTASALAVKPMSQRSSLGVTAVTVFARSLSPKRTFVRHVPGG